MRGALKIGVPIAAGLATGGYALSQGEDPGSAILAGAAGGLGAYGGLQLAGRYAPALAARTGAIAKGRKASGLTKEEILAAPIAPGTVGKGAVVQGPVNPSLNAPYEKGMGPTVRSYGKVAAAGLVPAGALAAGLGGVALGAIPGSMGVPGFQQGMAIDPESPGSSNTASAKYGVTPYASTQYM
jgi:hypothetical protein